MITAGVDCGAQKTKSVILGNGEILGKGSIPTGFDPARAADQSLVRAVDAAGMSRDDIEVLVATGSGKDAVDIAGASVSDVRAAAKAAHFFHPGSRTVVDVGAEEARAASINERGGAGRLCHKRQVCRRSRFVYRGNGPRPGSEPGGDGTALPAI